MFTQTVEYALRAVVHLAAQGPSACTTEQIAKATKVPQAYLSKVLQALSRAGIVRSQRGIGGGVALAKTPEELTILEVVNAVDPIRRITKCPLGLPDTEPSFALCTNGWTRCWRWPRRRSAQTTLAEVLKQPTKSIPCASFLERAEGNRKDSGTVCSHPTETENGCLKRQPNP